MKILYQLLRKLDCTMRYLIMKRWLLKLQKMKNQRMILKEIKYISIFQLLMAVIMPLLLE